MVRGMKSLKCDRTEQTVEAQQERTGTTKMNRRVKVTILCNRCGERFVLRGRKEKGQIQTGFKKCLCDNDRDFQIHEENV